jgi:protein-S-isoprenylcysteine O-methyltransferase Ste14
MQASDFEFRNRFWMIGGIFFVGFGCYAFDRKNAVQALLDLVRAPLHASEPQLLTLARLVFLAGALMIALTALVRTWATAYLKVAVVQDHALHSEGLVADGPYRFVRNPLYLATILMSLGVAPMASRVGCFVLIAAMLVPPPADPARGRRSRGGPGRELPRLLPRRAI